MPLELADDFLQFSFRAFRSAAVPGHIIGFCFVEKQQEQQQLRCFGARLRMSMPDAGWQNDEQSKTQNTEQQSTKAPNYRRQKTQDELKFPNTRTAISVNKFMSSVRGDNECLVHLDFWERCTWGQRSLLPAINPFPFPVSPHWTKKACRNSVLSLSHKLRAFKQ